MAASAIESSSRSNVSVQSTYRTTCDNCMRSKVRCSKDRPSCHRCLGQAAVCVYSPSRRLKKVIECPEPSQQAQSTTNGLADFPSIVSSRNEREYSPAAILRDDCVSPPSVSSSANEQPCPSPWSFFGNDGDMQESVAGMDAMESMESMVGMTQSAAALTALQPLQNKSMEWPTNQWSRSMETSTGEALVPISPVTSSDFISCLFASSGDNFSSSTLDTRRGTSISSEVSSIEEESSKAGCAWLAASILQSLESPGAPLKYNSQSSSASQGRLCRNLDTVISTNKAVLEVLQRIPGCTCSVPGNHHVIVSAVLFMVLAWYEACLGAFDRAWEQGVVKAGSGDSGVSKIRNRDANNFEVDATPVRHTDSVGTGPVDDHAELVSIPPIQVGSLQLGTESKRQVVAQIVLTELAKVTKVMESLTERSSSTTVGVGGYQELEGQLQFSLRAALQTRIEKISQAAERLSR